MNRRENGNITSPNPHQTVYVVLYAENKNQNVRVETCGVFTLLEDADNFIIEMRRVMPNAYYKVCPTYLNPSVMLSIQNRVFS